MGRKVDISTLISEIKEYHDQYPSWTFDNAFIHWFLRAFLIADPEAAAQSVTGVTHDKGVDGIYIDDNVMKVFLLQGKFHKSEHQSNESRNDILSFARLAHILSGSEKEFKPFLNSIDSTVGAKLEKARNRVLHRRYGLSLHYVTTGRCSSPLKDEADAIANQANGQTELNILDRKEVLTLLDDYLGGAAPPVPYLDLKIDNRGIVGSDGVLQRYDKASKIESWIISMTGEDIAALYEKAGDRLFARNIRGWLGNTSINKGIRNTIDSDPEHFWYFNNGVTIVCNAARKTSERGQAILRVSNPQVINGQQTTRSLHKSPNKQTAVLVRVISIPRDPSAGQDQFEELISNIVAATNWQNAISHSDLRSNDQRQILLERELAKLRYHYIRKKQTKQEAKRQLGHQYYFRIKKDELAQIVAACELDPHYVRSGKENLFSCFYDNIFDGRSAYKYLAQYWLGRAVKSHSSGYPERAYAKWHVMKLVWSKLESSIKKKVRANVFIRMCEKDRGKNKNQALNRVIHQMYLMTLEFYRKERGKGSKAIDLSNFFYRPHIDKKLEKHWNSKTNKRRARMVKYLRIFEQDLAQKVEV